MAQAGCVALTEPAFWAAIEGAPHRPPPTSVGEGAKIFRIRVPTARQCNALPPNRQGWVRSAQRWLGDIASIPGRETS